MSELTDIDHDKSSRPTIPPPERDAAQPEIAQAPAFVPTQPAQPQGNWFHRNRWFTKEPLSYTAYQFFRSTMATIPYGFGMAFFHHVFGLLNVKGQEMGLTPQGIDKIGKEGMAAVDQVSEFHKAGTTAMVGRNLMRFASSPINQALQIGLAFSMFRFTGGLVKGLRDKVMDEKNSPADTEHETKNWAKTLGDLVKVNWKAEAVGTFWAALTLGFISANFKQSTPYVKQAGENLFQACRRVWSKQSKLLQNAAIWTVSYSTFFEVDERIQKDSKLRQGTWKGSANSLINGPSSITGEPPDPQANGREKGQEDHAPKHEFFTHDPGLPRLVIRRLLPVAVGITAYAVLKRAGYVAAGGQMQAITPEIAHGGLSKNLGQFVKNSWREGAATAMFGALWMATDAWGSWYDKFFENLQHSDKPHRPLNEHQSHKMAELHERLQAKEQGLRHAG